ncbi:MAG: T9SS type A sorting domain-containing protein, partial [Draconibacterium sp.]|nr:T9SS type A sorting domain-containing protein [Draconibacterium sp.]
DYDEISFNVPETYGSFCIDTALTTRNVEHETYFVPGKKHEFYGVSTGNWRETGPNEYWDTVQWKISDFFFDIFKPEVEFNYETSGTTLTCYDVTPGSVFSKWDFGNGETGTGNEVSHTFASDGNYDVKLTTCNNNMACDTLIKKIKVGTPVGIKSLADEQLIIYPNPAKNKLNISGINLGFKYQVFDLFGREHLIKNHIRTNVIDISKLKSGIYILKLESSQGVAIRKFQKTD